MIDLEQISGAHLNVIVAVLFKEAHHESLD